MNKLFLFFITITLVLLIPVSAFGAIHLPVDTYAITDTWFIIGPDQPYLEVHYRARGAESEDQDVGCQFYRKDQSFFALNSDGQGQGGSHSQQDTVYWSFLTGFGLFAGIYLESNSGSAGLPYGKTIISPGFRLALDDLSYIAISVDYLSIDYYNDLPPHNLTNELADYEINLRYYTDNLKIFGDIKSYTKAEYGDNYYRLGANYQVIEPLVVGASLIHTETSNQIFVGGTFKIKPLIIDGLFITNSYSTGNSTNQLTVSGMFLLSDFIKIGAEYDKYSLADDGSLTLKAAAGGQRNKFIFKYRPENDSYTTQMSLSYEHKL